jgi:hypothetical protein
MRRGRYQLLRGVGAVVSAMVTLILLDVVVQALGGGSHPIAAWALVNMDAVFRPVGHWFVAAPDWAWISVIMVLGFPAAILLTWVLDVAGIGIKRQHKPRWVAGLWIIAVTMTCAGIWWARMGGVF